MSIIARGKWRGHDIVYERGQWFYADVMLPVRLFPERPCGACGAANTDDGHDGCIVNLPKVVNACCGHGVDDEAYVMFEDGTELRGRVARYFQKFYRT